MRQEVEEGEGMVSRKAHLHRKDGLDETEDVEMTKPPAKEKEKEDEEMGVKPDASKRKNSEEVSKAAKVHRREAQVVVRHTRPENGPGDPWLWDLGGDGDSRYRAGGMEREVEGGDRQEDHGIGKGPEDESGELAQ